MARKKKYNIDEDLEIQKMFKEYFVLRDWWKIEKQKIISVRSHCLFCLLKGFK